MSDDGRPYVQVWVRMDDETRVIESGIPSYRIERWWLTTEPNTAKAVRDALVGAGFEPWHEPNPG